MDKPADGPCKATAAYIEIIKAQKLSLALKASAVDKSAALAPGGSSAAAIFSASAGISGTVNIGSSAGDDDGGIISHGDPADSAVNLGADGEADSGAAANLDNAFAPADDKSATTNISAAGAKLCADCAAANPSGALSAEDSILTVQGQQG